MIYQITHRYDGRVLYECEAESLKRAVEQAAKSGADLYGADLYRADLYGADLREADLYWAKLNWQSHNLLSEILRQAAGDDCEKLMVAGLIAISTDWCWDKLMSLDHPQKAWAIAELAKWIQDGDDVPKQLLGAMQKPERADQ